MYDVFMRWQLTEDLILILELDSGLGQMEWNGTIRLQYTMYLLSYML